MTDDASRGTGRPRPGDPLFPPGTPLAMAYVPMQKLENIYEPGYALKRGTLYPELDKPWQPELGRRAK
ncbi:MAG: spore coat associated protein CotJA [Ethanoligenens sp.]